MRAETVAQIAVQPGGVACPVRGLVYEDPAEFLCRCKGRLRRHLDVIQTLWVCLIRVLLEATDGPCDSVFRASDVMRWFADRGGLEPAPIREIRLRNFRCRNCISPIWWRYVDR
jgi:hypothetical protein